VKVGAMAVVLQGCCKIAARLTFSVVRTTHTWAPILLLDRNCPIVYIHNVCSCRHLEPSALRSSKNMGSATMSLGEGRGTGRMHRLQDSARSTSPLLHNPISHPIVSFSLCHDQRLDGAVSPRVRLFQLLVMMCSMWMRHVVIRSSSSNLLVAIITGAHEIQDSLTCHKGIGSVSSK
jgi:hypothetical protein